MAAWKDVPGYEDLYRASDEGQIYSKTRKKLLRQSYANGYLKTTLVKDKIEKTVLVHRLIAITFLPNPNNYPCVNHKDELKDNNKVENLEWCTYSYNINYGTAPKRNSLNHINHKSLSKSVLCYKDGMLLKEYSSIHEAQRQTNVKNYNIVRCCKGKTKKAGGYVWKYK